MHVVATVIAAGWYTPSAPTPSAPDSTLVWGIAVIVAFLLGWVSRADKQSRQRSRFDDLNEALRDEAELRIGQRDSQIGLDDGQNGHSELVGQRKLPPESWN
jgi:hypothetical protein